MWYARSPKVIHSHFMESMVWLRVPGDIVFSIGVLFLAVFALRLVRGGAPKEVAIAVPEAAEA
jgi:nitric oxide reductase subunit B